MDKKDLKYIQVGKLLCDLSDDTKKGVSTLIVKDDNIISHGVNELPYGAEKTNERCTKPGKDFWMLHSERNAIYKASRAGISLVGAKMYCTYFPCSDCARAIIQSGIKALYSPKPDFNHHKWGETWVESEKMLRECNVSIIWTNKDSNE